MVSKNYKTYSVKQVDAKLARDIKEHKMKNIRNFIFVLIILSIIFRGTISYWLKFGFPHSNQYQSEVIDVDNDPYLNIYTNEEKTEKTFTYKSLINGNEVTVVPQASYKISGMVIAYNHDFLLKNNFFDTIALYDVGLAWGKLANEKIFKKYFKSYSQKNELSGSRVLWVEPKTFDNIPIKINEAVSHFSHSHIVPANSNIMGAFLKIKDWDKVEIEGYLVDLIYINQNGDAEIFKTSLSTTDIGISRGSGTNETIYVTKVKINHRVYY
ncbi:hypothetical protein J6G99_01885 [bacterium]|nr:hypothetical protein [bacterium]